MPFYASAEQIMRDRSEYARKNVARGRGVAAVKYPEGVLFVAENPSNTLHKLGEIYDRIGFAAAGRYNEYETLRVAGIRYADVRGYSASRLDVTGRALANYYAQILGAIFTEQQKPYEVELCVAEVGEEPEGDQLYRLSYDGSIVDEPEFVVMGGQAEAIRTRLGQLHQPGQPLAQSLRAAVTALNDNRADGGAADGATLGPAQLEVAVLDRNRRPRSFRRVRVAALQALLDETAPAAASEPPTDEAPAEQSAEQPADDRPTDEQPTGDQPTGDPPTGDPPDE